MDSRRGALRGLVRAQAVASIGLLPLTVFLFGQASLAGPVANLVAVPLWSLVVAPLAVAGVAMEAIAPALSGMAWRGAAHAFDLAWPLFEAMGSSRAALLWLPEARAWAMPLALLGAVGRWPSGAPSRGVLVAEVLVGAALVASATRARTSRRVTERRTRGARRGAVR